MDLKGRDRKSYDATPVRAKAGACRRWYVGEARMLYSARDVRCLSCKREDVGEWRGDCGEGEWANLQSSFSGRKLWILTSNIGVRPSTVFSRYGGSRWMDPSAVEKVWYEALGWDRWGF